MPEESIASVKTTKPFVSYNQLDSEAVGAICTELRNNGIHCWMDTEQIPGGERWGTEVQKAIEDADEFLLFVGKHDVGDWQERELNYVLSHHRHGPGRIIPVVLPGGNIPTKIGLTDLVPVEFPDSSYDIQAFDRLISAIKGQSPRARNTNFEIRVPVPDRVHNIHVTEKSALFMASADTPKEMQYLVGDALREAGWKVLQTFDATKDDYEPEIENAIRATSMVCADYSSNSKTNKPDADTMFSLGMAYALGTQIILIADRQNPPPAILPFRLKHSNSDACFLLYDSDTGNGNHAFIEGLESLLADIWEAIPFPHVIRRQNRGIRVNFAKAFHVRVACWEQLSSLLTYGELVSGFFADFSSHVARLQQVVELQEHFALHKEELDAIQTLRKIGDGFLRKHGVEIENGDPELSGGVNDGSDDRLLGVGDCQTHYLDIGRCRPKQEVFDAFQELGEGAEEEISNHIQQARSFLDLAIEDIDATATAYRTLGEHLRDSNLSPRYQITRAQSDITFLATCVEQVQIQVSVMTQKLIDLTGGGPEFKGVADDDAKPVSA